MEDQNKIQHSLKYIGYLKGKQSPQADRRPLQREFHVRVDSPGGSRAFLAGARRFGDELVF